MRVFLTGATGFVGSAIVTELLDAGHKVLGLARSDEAAKSLTAAGAEVHRGALDDLDSLRRGAAASDGVIHCAFIHDFSKMEAAGKTDKSALDAIGDVLAGSGRPFVSASPTAITFAPGRLATEEDPPDPRSAGAPRVASEQAAVALASRGVRASVVRLPLSVHGDGDHAFVPFFIGVARERRVSAYVGEGLNRWPAVHRLDAAHLFRLALEKGSAGARYHAIGDEGVLVRDIAQAIGQGLNVPVFAKAPEEAEAHFGWLAHFASADMPVSGARTRQQLGWQPKQPSLILDLEKGRYFATYVMRA